MCFFREKENWEVKTAKEDIVCYKDANVIDSAQYHYSYYRDFKYVRHKLYRIWFWWPKGDCIYKGFHSYIVPNHVASVKCIIPKGSRYLVNYNCKEYVSNKIIVGEDFKAANFI